MSSTYFIDSLGWAESAEAMAPATAEFFLDLATLTLEPVAAKPAPEPVGYVCRGPHGSVTSCGRPSACQLCGKPMRPVFKGEFDAHRFPRPCFACGEWHERTAEC